ncbi:MAG: DUF4314 domain-containing protein [Spirochaetales bacterium]|nr:DUF4314 domain-containing protein [Spirochaetales bacterium]
MTFPSREQIALLREQYRKGMKVRLVSMDDIQAPPPGAIGEVFGVDDAGSVMVRWETGSSLSLIPGEDRFEIV